MPLKPQAITRSNVMRKKPERSHLVRSEAPEDALWRNVVRQAIDDATMRITATVNTAFGRDMTRIRDQAREWITEQRKDFRLVCELAGLEHQRVHALAMGRIKEAIQKEHNARAERLAAESAERLAAESSVRLDRGVVDNFSGEAPDRYASDARESPEIGFCENGAAPS
jgi:hypothetical protein